VVVIVTELLCGVKDNQIKGARWAGHVAQMWAERKVPENRQGTVKKRDGVEDFGV
jgi:hypothetical protein